MITLNQNINRLISFSGKPVEKSKTEASLSETFSLEKDKTLPRCSLNMQRVYTDIAGEYKYFSKFLSKSGRLTREEYDDIIKNHKAAIMKAARFCDKSLFNSTTPENLAEIATAVNSYLKDTYGDYRIISVGTSPSALTEQLELMGNDVIFLPCSNLMFFSLNDNKPNEVKNLNIILDFLQRKGLKNDDKTNLIIDYCSSGKTLDSIYSFITQKFDDIPFSKFKKISLARLLDGCFKDETAEQRKKIKDFLQDISNSTVTECTNMPHFHIVSALYCSQRERESTIFPFNKNTEEIYTEFDNFSRPLGRAFSLCTFNEIQKLNADSL
ncbi:MAG: hypothetical protein ACI37R_01560 [Candidatus Avigastranaerophilus sp.]